MKKIILIISIILCASTVFAQENKDNFEGFRKNAISFNFLGTTPVIGLTYERIVTNYTSLEVGVGTNSVGLGAKMMPFKIKESTMMFTTGLTATYADYKDGFLANGKRVQLYVPIGISYYGTKGFNFGLDVGPGYRMYIKDSNSSIDDNGFLPWAGIKIGQRF
jgi:hypothetical protein